MLVVKSYSIHGVRGLNWRFKTERRALGTGFDDRFVKLGARSISRIEQRARKNLEELA